MLSLCFTLLPLCGQNQSLQVQSVDNYLALRVLMNDTEEILFCLENLNLIPVWSCLIFLFKK